MTAVWNRPADQLREAYAAQLDKIRASTELRPEVVQARMAKAYTDAKTAMDAMAGHKASTTAANVAAIKRQAFGIDDLKTGVSHAAQATLDMSFRDAQQRVAAIDTANELQWLLDTAEQTGDETLARAVGNHAINVGFRTVADTYLAARPAKAQAIASLDETRRSPSVATMFEHVLPKPIELDRFSDVQIGTLAGSTLAGS